MNHDREETKPTASDPTGQPLQGFPMTNMIKKDDPRLTAFVLGELSEAESLEIQNAVSNSSELALAVDEIRQTVELLGESYRSESPLVLLDDQKSRLVQSAVESKSVPMTVEKSSQSVGKSSRPWLPVAIAASLLGLLVGGAFYVSNPSMDNLASQFENTKTTSVEDDKDKEPASAGSGFDDSGMENERFEEDFIERKRASKADAMKKDSDRPGVFDKSQNGGGGGGTISEKSESGRPVESAANDKASLQRGGLSVDDEATRSARSFKALAPGKQSKKLVQVEEVEADFDGKSIVNDRLASRIKNEESKSMAAAPATAAPRSPGFDKSENNEEEGAEYFDQSIAGNRAMGGIGGAGMSMGAAGEDIGGEGLVGGAIGGGRVGMGARGGGGMGINGDGEIAGDGGMGMGGGQIAAANSASVIGDVPARNGMGGRGIAAAEKSVDSNAGIDARYGAMSGDERQTLEAGGVITSGARQRGIIGGIPGGIIGGGFPEAMDLAEGSSNGKRNEDLPGQAAMQGQLQAVREQARKNAEQRIAAVEEQKKAMDELGLEVVIKTRLEAKTRNVPVTRMTTQTKTRTVPVQRTRTETKIRMVDGKQQEYEVSVPYTENVTQSYTVQVPVQETRNQSYQIAVPYADLGLPAEKADAVVEELAASFDPNGEKEIKLEELFGSTVESLKEGEVKNATQAQKIAKTLLDEMQGKSKGKFNTSGVVNELKRSLEKRNVQIRNGDLIEEFGLEVGTKMVAETKVRTVPIQKTRTETKTRSVPVTRMRVEERTRTVDGKEEKYNVQVPYTEQVTQNYTVQVPYTENIAQSYQVQVAKSVLVLPEDQVDEVLEELTASLDPDRKRQLRFAEILAKVRSPNKKQSGKPTQAQKIGKILLKGDKAGFDSSALINQLKESLKKRNAEAQKNSSWKRVKAIPNTSRLMVGDKDELDLTGMQVNVQVDGFRARVLIDCFYYNNRGSQLEGNFKLRLPDDASLYYFAFGESAYDLQRGKIASEEFLDDGTQFVSLGAPDIRKARQDVWSKVKEARMVPREKAAHAYRETVRRKVDPALVEWSGAGVFNARVFPLAPNKLHRIVIGYDMNLTQTDDGWTYQLHLPEQAGQCQVDLNVQPVDGVEYSIEPPADPRNNVIGGKTHKRYRFSGQQNKGIRLSANKSPEILLHSNNDNEGKFWGIQVKPDLPVEDIGGSEAAIFMVDTSLSSNPDKFNVWLSMLKATLENNRDTLKKFNVLFFNVDGHFWQDGYVDNTSENVEELMAKCDKIALEGATDLYGAIKSITDSPWATESSTEPDLFLLSDGAANWGETNLRLIGRQLEEGDLGSLFAYQTGLTGTSVSNLRFLAGESGGAVFSVTTEDEIKKASMAHRKRPWKLESVVAAGASDTMTAGRVQWVYPGQKITVVGRGEVDGDIELNLSQAGKDKTVSIDYDEMKQVQSELASRLYGQIAVGQLESLGAEVFDVAASYARHFRVTGDTCSLLMLESEADYKRFDIKPEEDLFVIKSKVAKDLVSSIMRKSADKLADPKSQMMAWLDRLESMPGMKFKMPTALKLAIEDVEVTAISKPLDCVLTEKGKISDAYIEALKSDRLDYQKIATEADRRGGASIDEAIKVFSSLVERNPGDPVIARDVAFTAMELDRPAQAYHLLKRVAKARPFQGSVYPALGQCLAQLGKADMAIVYYEVALGGEFARQGPNFKDIVSAEYMHLLRQVVGGKMDSSVKHFAQARLDTLSRNVKFTEADVVVTMMWNTDQTDVDLHVIEPSGEECSYQNKRTRTNGQITHDVTTGFGPEMYFNADAPLGKFDIQVKYFANSQNRTELRNKVHLTIYRAFGTDQEQVDRRTVQLKTVGSKESVATIGVE